MNPEILLEAAAQVLRARPPAGIDAAYIDGFLSRNRAQLVEIVRLAFSAPSRERPLRRFEEEHRLARKVLDFAVAFLAQPKRDPDEAELLAEMLDGIADHAAYEDRVLFPALLREVPEAEHAIEHAMGEHELIGEHLFALTAALRAGRRYDGPAIPLILHHFEEEEEALLPLVGALQETPDGEPGRLQLLQTRIEALRPRPTLDAPPPEPTSEADAVLTPNGGARSGTPMPPERWQRGMRLVNEAGQHGTLDEVRRWVLRTRSALGHLAEETQTDALFVLDSGRTITLFPPAFAERRRPSLVVPDVRLDGRTFLDPKVAWQRVNQARLQIGHAAEKADAARKPDQKERWRRESASALRLFQETARAFLAWVAEHPEVVIEGFDPKEARRLTLELQPTRTPAEEWERAAIQRLPKDWMERWAPGDAVLLHIHDGREARPDTGWRITEVEGHEAELERGGQRLRLPLWMLSRNPTAPAAPATYLAPTEDRWLVDLGQELVVAGGTVSRAAVASAVKRYLAGKGVPVRTSVNRGAWVSSITLEPTAGRFAPNAQERLRALLPGLSVQEQSATFEPARREAQAFDPYADYGGKAAGLRIPAAEVPPFAASFAAALQAEGQALSRLGESLVAGTGSASPRGGADLAQRAAAASGCIDLAFELPGVGRVRVVCAQAGRRDLWHNLWVENVRYGYNGGRWAKGMRPPPAVLEAVRERGVAAFG
jgi:hypothetical protein